MWYINAKGTITITGAGNDAAVTQADERNKGVMFKNCAPFTYCISEVNSTQINNAKYLDVVMPMYNLIEYSDNYSKTSWRLWQYYRDEQNDNLTDSESGNTPANRYTKNVEIAVPLKHLSKFWGTLEIALINCEINFILTWSSTYVITNSAGAGTFAITERNFMFRL